MGLLMEIPTKPAREVGPKGVETPREYLYSGNLIGDRPEDEADKKPPAPDKFSNLLDGSPAGLTVPLSGNTLPIACNKLISKHSCSIGKTVGCVSVVGTIAALSMNGNK
jgi:hypothetical protein